MNTATRLTVDVWSDIACPWCYVGKRRLEGALARFAHRDQVAVRWHAFELDPDAPAAVDPRESLAQRLARKYGRTVAQAEAMNAHLVNLAKGEGIAMDFVRLRSGNTFDAHRLVHWAGLHGRQDEMKERLLRAYFSEGELMSDGETLVRLATEVGLDAAEARAMLARGEHADDVRADEQRANLLEIHGVPFFVFAERFGVSGAQSVDVLLDTLNKAWATTRSSDTTQVDRT